MFFHNMTFQIMFGLDNVIAMTTVVWTSRNFSEISIRVMFCLNMNFPHMPEVIRLPNAQAALVAEVASQSPQTTLLASCPYTAMTCLPTLYPFRAHL